MRNYTCVLLLAIMSAGCRGDIVREIEDLPLEGTTWRLESIDISGKISEPGEDEVYAFILEPDGFLSGQADCNECEGSYHYRDGGELVISMGCTEIACGSSESTFPHYSVYSSGVFDYRIEERTLTLQKRQSDNSLSLLFTGAE